MKVAVVMGSDSDFPILKPAVDLLHQFNVETEVIVASAHRTPGKVRDLVSSAEERGVGAFISAAGAAAHLAGVVASKTNLPVIAVPIASTTLGGLDSLLSSVQMPGGIPVATMAIGKAGAKNAALYACQIIALNDNVLYEKLEQYRKDMAEKITKDNQSLADLLK